MTELLKNQTIPAPAGRWWLWLSIPALLLMLVALGVFYLNRPSIETLVGSADINQRDHRGRTPLDWARLAKQTAAEAHLRSRGGIE